MPNLIKENNIFEEVEKRCQSFIESDPLINAYRKKELEDYFHKDELEMAKKENSYSIAKNLKQMNMDDTSISKATGLTIEEIRNLSPDGGKL